METLSDKRRTYTFYVDDAVLDVFGPRIGAYGIAVYILLARHAKQKECFPSYKHIMKQLGISRMTLWRTIALLIKEGLIHKEQRESIRGDLTSNLYTILDLSQYHTHTETPIETTVGSISGILPSICEVLPSICEVPEGVSLNGPQLKEGIPSPPTGDLPTLEKPVAKRTGKSKTSDYSPGFVAFWDAYPHERYAQKPTCYKLWLRHGLEPRTTEIVEKVERLKVTRWVDLTPNYIPLTSTWLNSGDFDTELIPLPKAVPTGGRVSPKTAQNIEISRRIIEEMDRGRNGQSPILLSTQHDG